MVWSDIRAVLLKAVGMMRRWRVLCREEDAARLEEVVEALEQKARESPRIGWFPASLRMQESVQGSLSSVSDIAPVLRENVSVVFPAVTNP